MRRVARRREKAARFPGGREMGELCCRYDGGRGGGMWDIGFISKTDDLVSAVVVILASVGRGRSCKAIGSLLW